MFQNKYKQDNSCIPETKYNLNIDISTFVVGQSMSNCSPLCSTVFSGVMDEIE